MTRFQALAIHTERIHDPLVWRRLRFILNALGRKGSHATLFVYPFRAIVEGKSHIALNRIERVRSAGHEIAQHTHFYKGQFIDKPNKVTDLSQENISNCLRRDHQWLSRICLPRGFTSGAWIVTPDLYPTLVELEFDYDCSARLLGWKKLDHPHILRLSKPEIRRFKQGELLLIPTTHGLKDALFYFRSGDLQIGLNNFCYRLVYFHDYDLLRWEAYFAALALVLVGGAWKTCGELADILKGGCLE
jgi:hypothetical protein